MSAIVVLPPVEGSRIAEESRRRRPRRSNDGSVGGRYVKASRYTKISCARLLGGAISKAMTSW